MRAHTASANRALLGTPRGIKRRALARKIVAFMQWLDPPPPNATITTTRHLLRVLFGGRAVSNTALHRHFATAGRKADDRADVAALQAWLEVHRARLRDSATQRLAELELEWRRVTQAADEAGQLRQPGRP